MSNPKNVFSYAMMLIDKIRGWEDEEKRVGSKFATCTWVDLHQGSFGKRTNTKSSNGGVLEEANVVHITLRELGLCWNIRRSRMGVREYNQYEE